MTKESAENTLNKYPRLDVNLNAIEDNAGVMFRFCASRGLSIAGVIKFSDGAPEIAKAYSEGGCIQIASSRLSHLKTIKETMPDIRTMLIRIPMISEADEAVRWCDYSLNSEETVLQALDEAAGRAGKPHNVILMQDVGDRREGIVGTKEITQLAVKVERKMENLHLAGIGASFACVSGVLPDWKNLSQLAKSARKIEEKIGRQLEIVSGGSSINLTMLTANQPLPPEINHLRIGGAIANPIGIRLNRDVKIAGMKEDTFRLTAEVIEVAEKPSISSGPGKNWAGQTVEFEDEGTRKRAVIALGSQDISDPAQLIPDDPAVRIIGGSSDHTVLDVTESETNYRPGDTVTFRMFYMPLLQCFATRHVFINYISKGQSL